MVPANIRFKFYATPAEVKLENKFAAIPLTIPMTKDMESAYPLIKKATKKLKNSMSFVYACYAMGFWSNILFPKIVPRLMVDILSNKYTISFSNTPGPIKPFFYYNREGGKIRTIASHVYVIVPGKIGVNVACISFCNSFKVTVTSDENIMSNKEVD